MLMVSPVARRAGGTRRAPLPLPVCGPLRSVPRPGRRVASQPRPHTRSAEPLNERHRRTSMIGLADLGLAPVTEEQSYEQDPHLDPDVEVDPYAPGPLQPGSIEAQAVWHTWRGQGVVIVNSPPGAGKSTLVARIIHRLAYETDLKIVVATPTVAAGVDLSRRLAQVTGPGYVMPSG